MYGAILGDIIGSPYEYDRGDKRKDFKLFTKGCRYTDDSIMTAAVGEALLSVKPSDSDGKIRDKIVESLQRWGRKYPSDYGFRFQRWLYAEFPGPYGSYGNGSAMRVSAAGWLYDSLEKTEHMAKLTAEVTHNHLEGIRGAVVTAGIIYLARHGTLKEDLRAYAKRKGYRLDLTCDEIRPAYHHVESCQETVPPAITAFLEGKDFEDVIRTAVSLGGDADTLTCIAGGMAEACYGVPEWMKEKCREMIPEEMRKIADEVESVR